MIREFRTPWLLVCAATISFAMVGVPATIAQDAGAIQDNKVEPDADASDAAAKSKVIPRKPIPRAERSERLQRRAGEQVGGDARGRSVVLGMHVQEADNNRAKVVEVAPASAAFDAGIREGDEIVSFDGFKADTYREWIDGMRTLATDAPDGDTLPITLVRDGKRLNLRLRVPVSRAGEVPQQDSLALNQQVVPGQPGQPGIIVPGQQPGGLVGGAGDNILIADAFGDQFNDPNGGTTERAIAEIFRLNAPPQPVPTVAGNAPSPAQRNAPARAGQDLSAGVTANVPGARIGLAGFRNDANGLFVMLDVGGLQPGNYLVGIDDPSVLAAGGNVGANAQPVPRQRSQGFNPRSSTIEPPRVGPNTVPSPQGRTTPSNATPSGGQPAGNNQPQSRLQQPVERQTEIPRTVLAQVVDSSQAGASDVRPPTGAGPSDIPATGQTVPAGTPATGRIEPIGAPATGEVDPTATTPTGKPRTADARRDPTIGSGAQPGIPPTGAGPTLRIGMLAVDQSGTGRLQQVVEGVQVQDVVGQAIAIYSQNAAPQTTLPPNLDAAADPVAGQQPAGTTRLGNTPPGSAAQPAPSPVAPRGANAATAGVGATIPVAGGLIRLMSDLAPTDAVDAQTDETVPVQQTPLNPQNDVPPTVPNTEQIR